MSQHLIGLVLKPVEWGAEIDPAAGTEGDVLSKADILKASCPGRICAAMVAHPCLERCSAKMAKHSRAGGHVLPEIGAVRRAPRITEQPLEQKNSKAGRNHPEQSDPPVPREHGPDCGYYGEGKQSDGSCNHPGLAVSLPAGELLGVSHRRGGRSCRHWWLGTRLAHGPDYHRALRLSSQISKGTTCIHQHRCGHRGLRTISFNSKVDSHKGFCHHAFIPLTENLSLAL